MQKEGVRLERFAREEVWRAAAGILKVGEERAIWEDRAPRGEEGSVWWGC